jgi:hypothetical protein
VVVSCAGVRFSPLYSPTICSNIVYAREKYTTMRNSGASSRKFTIVAMMPDSGVIVVPPI